MLNIQSLEGNHCCHTIVKHIWMLIDMAIIFQPLEWDRQHPKLKHDDINKWKHFPRYWTFVQGIHWSPVNSMDKGQWHGALMFSLIYTSINCWVNNREARDLRCYCAHYDVTVMNQIWMDHTHFWRSLSVMSCILLFTFFQPNLS